MRPRPEPDHRLARRPSPTDALHRERRQVRVVVGSHFDELVALKTGSTADAIVAVEREGLVLSQLRHPNVVELVRTERTDTSATLVTQFAGPTTLVQARQHDAADVARVGATLLTIVGELHSMGWVHGRLLAEHCIVGDDGRLTLCALGGAHRVEPRDPRRSDELGDVVSIVSDLAERLPVAGDRASRRRLRRLHAALAAVGDHPTPADAEQLRLALTQVSGSGAPAARHGDPSVTRPSDRTRARRRQEETTRPVRRPAAPRPWRGLAATAGTLLTLFGAIAFLRWVGGPLGLAVDDGAVRRVGDLPEPVVVALTVVRIAAFVACGYGIALAAATLGAIVTRRRDIARLAVSLAPARLRHVIIGLIGLGMLAGAATGPGDPSTTAGTTISASTTVPTATVVDHHGTTTADAFEGPPPGVVVTPPTVDRAPDPMAGLPNLWVMGPGDHLWGVAAEALARHHERPARGPEIDAYWRRLIDLNRASLVDPDNPDLVFAGQVIELPPFD